MPSDLERNLVSGGITPAAAKVIANALANLATSKTQSGRQLTDATPLPQMRMIDSNTRKYLLTNLDYEKNSPFKPSAAPSPAPSDHPYKDSQPAASAPTVSTPAVKPGPFVSVGASTSNNVAQSEVSLRIAKKSGRHARLNNATGEIEAVPISVQIEPKGLLEAEVVEEEEQTVIKIRVVSAALRGLLRKKLGATTQIAVPTTPPVNATLYVNGEAMSAGEAFVLVPE